jgi:PAS domain S-box-containing protein
MGARAATAYAASRRAAQAVLGVAVLLVLAFSLTVLPGVRSDELFHPGVDGWLQGSAYGAIVLVALVPALAGGQERLLWWLITLALALRALGFVLGFTVVRRQVPPPWPSVADYAWFAMDVVLVVALWALLRLRVERRSVGIFVDAVLVALTTTGAVTALLFHWIDFRTGRDLPDDLIVVNLAYPMADVAMLVIVVAVLLATGVRSRSTLVLGLGILGMSVVDTAYLFLVTDGTFHPGLPWASLSLLATLAVALAGWVPRRDRKVLPALEFSRVGLTATAGVVAVLTLMYDAFEQVTAAAVLLPAGALVVGIGRAVWTVGRNRGIAEVVIGEQQAERLRFQSLVETSGDFIAMATPDGSVTYVNPAGRELVGIGDRDVATMSIADFLTPEGLASSVEVERPAVLAEGRWSGESTLRDHQGGPPIPVAISSFLMRDPRTGEPFALATVQRDISERVAAEAALERLADERQHLLDRLVQAQEDERARIAADVHDDSVQALAAVELRLGLLRRRLGGGPPELAATADDLAGTVREAIGRLRTLLFDLESPAVETDLATALGVAAENAFGDRLVWRVTGGTALGLPEAQRVTAYRIAREAMANVVRHAAASTVEIRLSREGSGVEIVVEDDGRGFDPATVRHRRGHLGIPAMADRATIAGGRLVVERREEGGTRVRVWLPSVVGAPEGLDGADSPEDPV